MSHWARKYTDDQRAAIERAGIDLRIRPMTDIRRMAAAGELRPRADAEPLPPFEIPDASLRTIITFAERRRAGKLMPAHVARQAPRDRADQLQRRLAAMIDAELSRLERETKGGKRQLDMEQARRVARALRELGTLPDPKDMRLPRTPGDRVPGSGERAPDARTTGGLAGQLLAASSRHAGEVEQARDHAAPSDLPLDQQRQPDAEHATHHDENNDTGTHHARDTYKHGEEEEPCSPEASRAAGLAAIGVSLGV